MTRSDDARMLAYAANRAKAHPHYLGWVLARYSKLENIAESDLAKILGDYESRLGAPRVCACDHEPTVLQKTSSTSVPRSTSMLAGWLRSCVLWSQLTQWLSRIPAQFRPSQVFSWRLGRGRRAASARTKRVLMMQHPSPETLAHEFWVGTAPPGHLSPEYRARYRHEAPSRPGQTASAQCADDRAMVRATAYHHTTPTRPA